jgi:LDH2 family malate/lactate/ureidoglycolate dehydrogenase
VAEISRATPAEGVDRVLLPGEREWANRNRSLAEGIFLPADVREKLAEAAQLAGI